jgi:transcriptional regulator with XRE-family HTH domain
MDHEYQTPEELQRFLGDRLKLLRVDRRLTQSETAAKAGVSLRAVQKLEAGEGSTLETFLRFLKAIDHTDVLEMLAPTPTISPMAMLNSRKRPSRVRHSRKEESQW